MRVLTNEVEKEGHPPKRRYFTAIDLFSIEMVADRHRHAAYHNSVTHNTGNELLSSVNMDDLECCLLYTSPSPRDRQKSRMPSSA